MLRRSRLSRSATPNPLAWGFSSVRPRRACPAARRFRNRSIALDVLIPLIDLRQENRCDIASVPVENRARSRSFLLSERFWSWLKALYAIAGWFIVSLAILTFAQANRTKSFEGGE